MRYHGNRGSQIVDVLGTAALSILCGHWRYAHINAVRGDTLNPPLLGMTRAVSEDMVGRGVKRIEGTLRPGLAGRGSCAIAWPGLEPAMGPRHLWQ